MLEAYLTNVGWASCLGDTATLVPTYPRPSSTPELDPCFEFQTLAWTLWNPSRFTVFTRDPIDTPAAQRSPPVPPRYWKDVVCVAGGLGKLEWTAPEKVVHLLS